MRSNQEDFIKYELRTPQNVLVMFSRYGFLVPSYQTVEKWFQRKSIPSSYLFVLLALIELERGQPISLATYVRGSE